MRRTELFTKTSKTAPADEQAKNAQLLIRAGFIHKEMAGVYAYLPLGLRVLENIKSIVREEMNVIGGQELIMTNLQPRDVWEVTTRWDDKIVDIWFKTHLASGEEVGLAWSHEEPIMNMMRQFIHSYRDLPTSVYQFQTKLRNELRAKSGIMRGREFVMKDMYSLHASAADLDEYYEKVKRAYLRVFERLGIGNDTFITFASGGAFTKFSHEFQTICDAGEDVLYLNRDKKVAVNEEVLEEALTELNLKRDEMEKVKSAEVGNIFNFGTEKAEQMGIYFTRETGEQQPIYLASYGIGVTRLMGVIAEKFADDRGLVWPESVAPFRIILVRISDDEKVVASADKLYKDMLAKGISVLYDDRPADTARAGEKFADAELMGIPHRIVVSPKLTDSGEFEYKNRTLDVVEVLTREALFDKLA